ncbi:hypothetical protein KC480_05320 [Bacillus velezensis]|uniref:hypothetical protein n=1 Tax=Bacillus velezensis TaxID=492670 RepID=UPI001E4C5E38|nr:hypothetical protein [Bacillus velezensis]MCD7910945.1 hypothetical protein [Bacillus velezensis]
MDIISLSKVNKALKGAQNLDESKIGKRAESRFISIDARLDWLEQQLTKLIAKNSIEVDLSRGVFNNTEMIDGELKLGLVNEDSYTSEGSWESEVIDLSESWLETKEIIVR